MAYTTSNENLSPEEKKFQYNLTRGDEFMNIEIFRNAKWHYNQALEMNMNNELVYQKLAICNEKIVKERKSFIGIAIVVAVIIGIIAFIRML